MIDLERVVTIDNIKICKNVKILQSLFGHFNFVRIFVSNFAKIIKPIAKMLKKGRKIEWDEEALQAFSYIKRDN